LAFFTTLLKKGEMIMLRSINIRSFLIGGLLFISVMCLMGAISFKPSEYHGRFKIKANQHYAFIIDSDTGQVWSQHFPDEPSNIISAQPDEFHAPKIQVSHVIVP
jgi:hypothetical protein